MNAHDAIIRILAGQTIDEVRRRCKEVADAGFDQLTTHLDEHSEFVLTENRAAVLDEVTSGLREKASPCVILHGSYGSGKTVLMRNIRELCAGPRQVGAEGREFGQITYGETPIECAELSLEQNDTPFQLLYEIYGTLLSLPDSPDESAYLEAYKENRDKLTIRPLQENLTEEMWERIAQKHDDPQNLEDVATVAKELEVGEAFAVTAWLTTVYRDETGRYPGIYLDEFEQAFRTDISTREKSRLRRLVQKFLRKGVTGFEEYERPPFVLFANTLTLDDLRQTLDVERDFVDRIKESLSFGIDPTVEESQELLIELYRFYARPILADADEPYSRWQDGLVSARSSDQFYAYPFSSEALEKLLEPLQKSEDGRIIRGFRDFKDPFTEYLSIWDAETGDPIELDFLYRHGDAVREALQGRVERLDPDLIPGKESIENSIREEFADLNDRLLRVLLEIARVAVLERQQETAYFSPDEIRECGDRVEVRLDDYDVQQLLERVTNAAYFDADGGTLVLNREQLLDVAAPDTGMSDQDLLREVNERLGEEGSTLRERPLLDCWEIYYEQKGSLPSYSSKDSYIVFDVDNQLNYTESVALCVGSMPEALATADPGRALQFVVCFEDTPDEEYPVRFTVTELGNRASDIVERIESHLNHNLVEQLLDDDDRSEDFQAIREAFDGASLADAFKFALRLTLLREANDDDIDQRLRHYTFPQQVFAPMKMDSELTGIYDQYSLPLLGYGGSEYSGQDLLTLAYAIEYLRLEGTMEYSEPNHPDISIPSFRNVSRSNEVGQTLRKKLDTFEDQEVFLKDREVIGNYSQQMETQVKKIHEVVEHEETESLSLDDVYELLYGTTQTDAVAKAQVYLLLMVGNYNREWVLTSDDRLVSIENSLEARRERVEATLFDSVKVQLLDAVRGDVDADGVEVDEDHIVSTVKAYRNVGSASRTKLAEYESEYEVSKTEMPYEELNREMRKLASDDVLGHTDAGRYLNALTPLGDMNSDHLYLIYPRLDHLVSQLDAATAVLHQKATLDHLTDAYATLTNESLPVDPVSVDPVETVEEFYSNRTEGQLHVEADVDELVEAVLADETLVSDALERLRRTADSLVPVVAEYDASADSEHLTTEVETATRAVDEEMSEWRIRHERAEETLARLEQLVQSAEGWDRQAKNYLENVEEHLDVPATGLDAEAVRNNWNRWKEAKEKLQERAVDSSVVEELISTYGLDAHVDTVMGTSDIEIPDIVASLPEPVFDRLVRALDSESAEAGAELAREVDSDSVRRVRFALVRARALQQGRSDN